jgi:two-component system phosphate regulon response regulator PhoB
MSPSAASPKFVFIIEDDCDHASTLLSLLELEGYRAECVSSGAKALKRVEEVLPDLIVLDFTLPDMSGAEVGKSLRGDGRTGSIPIIIASGMPEWVVRSYFSDFDAFLGKPLDAEQALELISRLTESSPAEPRGVDRPGGSW